MTNLKKLAKEVSQCRGQGNLRGKGFPGNLRQKISMAAKKYGLTKVAQNIGIHRSVIARWAVEYPSPKQPRIRPSKKTKINDRPIVFQELPGRPEGEILTSPQCPPSNGAFLRLTSPAGFTIALGENPGHEVTAGIIRAFMGGQQ